MGLSEERTRSRSTVRVATVPNALRFVRDLTFSGAQSWYVVPAALILGIAVWLRLANLGALDLIVDEYYSLLSVEGIRDKGAPYLTSGVLYTRQLLPTYLMAASTYVFGVNEFALRLPGAIAGIGVVLTVFVMARKFAGERAGIAAMAVVAFSVWEVFFSRYARMYIYLQLFTLLALFFFFLAYVEEKRRYRVPALAATLAAVASHQLAVTLLPVFGIAALVAYRLRWRKYVELLPFLAIVSAALIGRLFLLDRLTNSLTSVLSLEASTGDIRWTSPSGHFLQFFYDHFSAATWLAIGGAAVVLAFGVGRTWITRSRAPQGHNTLVVSFQPGAADRPFVYDLRAAFYLATAFTVPLLAMEFLETKGQPRQLFYEFPVFVILVALLADRLLMGLTRFLPRWKHPKLRGTDPVLRIGGVVGMVVLLIWAFGVDMQESFSMPGKQPGDSIHPLFGPSTAHTTWKDYESVSRYVGDRLQTGDVVVSTWSIGDRFYGGFDSQYWLRIRDVDAYSYVEGRVPLSIYDSIPVLTSLAALQSVLAQKSSVWVIVHRDFHLDQETRTFLEQSAARREYLSPDGMGAVWHFTPGPP